MAHIGTLNERSLHRELKDLISRPADDLEVELEGYVIDIVRAGRLIEIQTGPLGPLSKKLDALLDRHDVTVVHPIAARTWLHKPDGSSRKSPTRRSIFDTFESIVSLPTLLDHPRFTLDVVLIEEDRSREFDPTLRRRRGGWKTVDRSIRRVLGHHTFADGSDLLALLPTDLPEPFTTADLAASIDVNRGLAQQMAYCLKALGLVSAEDRTRLGVLYRPVDQAAIAR